jgi:hypothetical protein
MHSYRHAGATAHIHQQLPDQLELSVLFQSSPVQSSPVKCRWTRQHSRSFYVASSNERRALAATACRSLSPASIYRTEWSSLPYNANFISPPLFILQSEPVTTVQCSDPIWCTTSSRYSAWEHKSALPDGTWRLFDRRPFFSFTFMQPPPLHVRLTYVIL